MKSATGTKELERGAISRQFLETLRKSRPKVSTAVFTTDTSVPGTASVNEQPINTTSNDSALSVLPHSVTADTETIPLRSVSTARESDTIFTRSSSRESGNIISVLPSSPPEHPVFSGSSNEQLGDVSVLVPSHGVQIQRAGTSTFVLVWIICVSVVLLLSVGANVFLLIRTFSATTDSISMASSGRLENVDGRAGINVENPATELEIASKSGIDSVIRLASKLDEIRTLTETNQRVEFGTYSASNEWSRSAHISVGYDSSNQLHSLDSRMKGASSEHQKALRQAPEARMRFGEASVYIERDLTVNDTLTVADRGSGLVVLGEARLHRNVTVTDGILAAPTIKASSISVSRALTSSSIVTQDLTSTSIFSDSISTSSVEAGSLTSTTALFTDHVTVSNLLSASSLTVTDQINAASAAISTLTATSLAVTSFSTTSISLSGSMQASSLSANSISIAGVANFVDSTVHGTLSAGTLSTAALTSSTLTAATIITPSLSAVAANTGSLSANTVSIVGQLQTGQLSVADAIQGSELTLAGRMQANEALIMSMLEAGSISSAGGLTVGSVSSLGALTVGSVSTSGGFTAGSLSSSSGRLTAASVSTLGGLTAGSFTSVGGLTAGSFTSFGGLTAAHISSSGDVTSNSISSSGRVTAVAAVFSGTLTANAVSVSGLLNTATLSVSGSLQAGALTVSSLSTTGGLSANGIVGTGAASFGSITTSGALSVGGALQSASVLVSGNMTANALSSLSATIGGELIVSTGSVGIGTASPQALLHVAGDVLIDGTLSFATPPPSLSYGLDYFFYHMMIPADASPRTFKIDPLCTTETCYHTPAAVSLDIDSSGYVKFTLQAGFWVFRLKFLNGNSVTHDLYFKGSFVITVQYGEWTFPYRSDAPFEFFPWMQNVGTYRMLLWAVRYERL